VYLLLMQRGCGLWEPLSKQPLEELWPSPKVKMSSLSDFGRTDQDRRTAGAAV
jgi:hypothetical protein